MTQQEMALRLAAELLVVFALLAVIALVAQPWG
jgi:Tfp pilus assembly protein FimT